MKYFIFLLAVISLTACTSTPLRVLVTEPDKKWEQRQTELSKINDWHLAGRVAIGNGDELWHLNMQWQRYKDKYILDLSGPFGIGHTQLTSSNDGVVLVDGNQNYFYAESSERLLQEVTGLRMPVNSLLYWIRGLPNWKVNKDKQLIDEFGRLVVLQQDGWQVRFKGYSNVEQHELPQKIFITGYDLKINIFVDEWDLKSKKFISVQKE